MSPNNLWSPDEERRLLELAATASRIVDVADGMGKTRNSIVGKLARMRRRGQVGEIEWSLRPNRYQAHKRSPRPRMVSAPEPPPKPRRGLPPPEPVRQAPEIISPRLLTLLELGPHHCRWPIGDGPPYLFCGAAAEPERSYCAVHHAVAHGR